MKFLFHFKSTNYSEFSDLIFPRTLCGCVELMLFYTFYTNDCQLLQGIDVVYYTKIKPNNRGILLAN